MPIIIRNVKKRSDGKESIRERLLHKKDISIGRGQDNDIVLSDLSLSLKHCKILQDAKGQIHLQLFPQKSALINGRLLTGRTLTLKPESKIRLGRFQLICSQNEEDGLILSVEQIEKQSTSAQTALKVENVFGLSKALPGKRLMAWMFSIVILGFFLLLPLWATQSDHKDLKNKLPLQADLSWNSGEISLMHSNLKKDCQTCHIKPFVAVQDEACTACHKTIRSHAKQEDLLKAKPVPSKFGGTLNQVSTLFGRPPERCTSCHAEHNTTAHLIPAKQKICADCHSNLHKSLPDTKLKDVSDFGHNHPQFSPTFVTGPDEIKPTYSRLSLEKNPLGFSGLKFSHKQHLRKGKAVDRMAGKLPKKYAFSDGVDCSDCHRPEAGGGLFEPVNMQQDCAMCHDLGFEKTKFGKTNNYLRTLRHGEPEEVIATIRDFYQAKTLANLRDVEKNTKTRRRPGRAARIRTLNARELAFKQADILTAAKVKSIFTKGGACYGCHTILKPDNPSSLDYRVKPISIDDRFYPKSEFKHESHAIGGLECKTCHKAETSEKSSDILLPKIKVCQTCHIGESKFKSTPNTPKGTIPTTCLTCHTYHDRTHSALPVPGKKDVTRAITP